ncbi:hypothetical protein FHS83_003768 [Rhizomicrobium palustre]|uniref:Uncharacterized protein n=1 Tax=Rhizomicrobium palustre TaxID=189966 RepID=A0A846N630_9PROT|nr:hypothetical protein [Rhizomicrobium palustre]NIK90450.1 hypothetical protein [Rhizomicrobium palustre]
MARGSDRSLDFTDFMVYLIALPLAGAAGLYTLQAHLQSRACPQNTFLHGSLGGDSLALTAGLFYLVLFIMVALLLLRAAPDDWSSEKYTFQQARPLLNYGSVACAGLAVILAAYTTWETFGQYCATPQFISYRASPITPFKQLAWSEISTIRPSCHYSAGRRYSGWEKTYLVQFKNGITLDFADGGGLKYKISTLRQILQGRHIRFDAGRVSRNCPDFDIYGTAP